MTAVNPVELAPLGTAKRADDGMVQEASVLAIGANRAINECVHLGDAGEDFGADLSGRQTFWSGWLRSLAAFRKIAAADDDHALKAIFHGRRASKRLARSKTSLESLNGSGVGEVEMFKDFGCTPLALGMTHELLIAETINGLGKVIL